MSDASGQVVPTAVRRRRATIGEVATLAGVSPTTVLNLENDEDVSPQRRTIRKLAAALGVEPAELLKEGA